MADQGFATPPPPDRVLPQYLVDSSPFTKPTESSLQNQSAKFVHTRSAKIHHHRMSTYFSVGLASSPTELERGAIAANEECVAALEELSRMTNADVEARHYGPTAHLLNIVSRDYYLSRLQGAEPNRDDLVIIFVATPTRTEWASYLGLHIRPDYGAFLATWQQLKQTIADRRYSGTYSPWSSVLAVGEHKRKNEDDMAQLKSYTSALKRYRPDLDTVLGFQIANGKIELASMNACGMWVSPREPVSKEMPWIWFVSSVYLALPPKDAWIKYNPEQEEFHRWDVQVNGERVAVVPFHCGPAPGRATFAAFVVSDASLSTNELRREFYGGNVEGFFKMSWQPVASRWYEGELLDHVHRDGWIPGLVRHKYTNTPSHDAAEHTETVDNPADNKSSKRFKEIIYLASIGEPLSQAVSPRHLLYALYDLLEAHLLACLMGVLHRDVSYNNCLIRPKHFIGADDKGKKVVKGRFISEIMHVAGCDTNQSITDDLGRAPGTDNGTFESCVLLTDFDHAAMIDVDKGNGDPHAARIDHPKDPNQDPTALEKTGTPMFIAVELVDAAQMPYNVHRDFNLLEDDLKRVERYTAAFAAAFPAGDKSFFDKFKKVLDLEQLRRTADRIAKNRPIPPAGHFLSFDAQSAFWTYLFAFSRCSPRNSDVDDVRILYDRFCKAMLNHDTTSATESDRRAFLESEALDGLFHPALAKLETLFERMANYLTIPWHLYVHIVDAEHAHIALRRLVLLFLLETPADILDIRLDTEKPRQVTATELKARQNTMSGRARASTSNSQPASLSVSSSIGSSLVPSDSGKQSRHTREDDSASAAQPILQETRKRSRNVRDDASEPPAQPIVKRARVLSMSANESAERAVPADLAMEDVDFEDTDVAVSLPDDLPMDVVAVEVALVSAGNMSPSEYTEPDVEIASSGDSDGLHGIENDEGSIHPTEASSQELPPPLNVLKRRPRGVSRVRRAGRQRWSPRPIEWSSVRRTSRSRSRRRAKKTRRRSTKPSAI